MTALHMIAVIARRWNSAVRSTISKPYRRAVTFAAVSAACFSVASEGLSSSREWVRFLTFGPPPPGIPFVLAYVDYTDYALSAVGWYRYTQGRNPVILHGEQ